MWEMIITIIASIFLPILLWLYTPQEFKNKLHKRSSNITIKSDKFLDELQRNNVILNNDDKLSSEYFIKEMRFVYFPVVPRRELNIIHLTFSRVIRNLENLGLEVIIFIFDDYYGKIKNLNPKIRDEHVINFVDSLQKMGVRSKIIYESKVYENKKYAQSLLKNILDLTSMFSIKEVSSLNNINKYISRNTKNIRHQKIFLNIGNFMCLPFKFGYILSGADETKMWQEFIRIYSEKYQKSSYTEVVLLSIPKVYNIKGEISNVLDNLSFSYTNNKEMIKEGVRGNLQNKNLIRKDCGIFYILHNLYFSNENNLMLNISNSDIKTFKNVDEFIDFCKINDMSANEFLINSLCNIISKIYHDIKI